MNDRMMLHADALLFDMDGTLVDSTAVSERIWRRWSAEQGADPEAVLTYSHGRRTLDTTRHFTRDEETALAAARSIEAQEIAADDGTLAIDGARALLERLPFDRWAVVTSAGPALASRRLAAAGLPIPQVLVTAGDVTKGKPDPEGYLLAARRLGVDPARCIVFEDTFAGHEAARRGGMRSINRHATPHEHDGPLLTLVGYRSVEVQIRNASLLLRLGSDGKATPALPVEHPEPCCASTKSW
ncbi:HAD-IA family hydrolase [Sphingomonas sp. DT-207]|uniref:HAD-IA family hydrolase n=1 Tax=Sphingomonas sp. DT-207 TaxID=3396167 RepID=UPI003F1B1033